VHSGRRLALALILGLPAALLFLLSILRPVAADSGSLVDPVLSAICHRIPDRCLVTPSGVTGLCGRCTFFWFGLAAGSFVLYHRPMTVPLSAGLLMVLLMAADGFLQYRSIYDNSFMRCLTGLSAGAGIAVIFLGRAVRTHQ